MLTKTLFALGKKIVPPMFRIKLVYLYFNTINLLTYGTTEMFSTIQVETLSTCNRRCWYCPNSNYQRPKKIMSTEMYKKIIDQLHDMNYRGIFCPHFYDEPLLVKRLPDLIAYARKRLPNCLIKIYTNGDFLTKESFFKLINKGADEFFITDHDNSLTKKGKTQNKETYIVKFKKSLDKKFQDKITIFNLDNKNVHNRGGLIDVEAKKRKKCDIRSLIIDYNGDVVLCCDDYFSKYCFGNANDKSILDIWNSKNFKSVRQKLRKGIFEFDICKKCAK